MGGEKMKKLLSLLLVPLMLLCTVAPVFGADYRQIAETYLQDKYGGKGAAIEVFEGGVMELEFTKESFWYAKYMINTEGKSSNSPTDGKRLPIVGIEPAIMPAPDNGTKPEPALTPQILPLPPQDIYYDNYIYGAVYIHLKTGKILEMDEMEPYYNAEGLLAQQEWERLSKEAGKIDVYLYRKLQGMSASQKIKVSIQPTTVISDELKAAFAALKTKYPKIAAEINYELENLIGGYGVSGNSRVGFAVAEDLVGGPDKAVSSGTMPAVIIDPARPTDKPLIIDPKHDDEYWQQMNAFWSEVEQLRQQSMAQSIFAIEAELMQMGVEYTATSYGVIAELSVTQLNVIAQHSVVAIVYEEQEYSTMAPELYSGRGAAVDNKMLALAATEDATAQASSNRMPLYLGAVISLGGVAFFVLRRLA